MILKNILQGLHVIFNLHKLQLNTRNVKKRINHHFIEAQMNKMRNHYHIAILLI